jgi:2-dehydro-3-deoxyphosphogluconate aldolase / (4S)-4-hydroxy-2-oxoglutarate aldolase
LGEDLSSVGLDVSACTEFFSALFDGQAVMAILRGMDPATTVAICQRAWQAGILVTEVAIEAEAAEPSLRAAVELGRRPGRVVGAGTVTTCERVQVARAAGAAFTVAPGLDADVARASLRCGLPHLPGVATPTDIQHAVRLGFRWLKVFPARELGTGWITAMAGPFPGLRLVATGGIGAGNAAEFLAAGASVVAVGSSLAEPDAIEYLASLRPGAQPGNRNQPGITGALDEDHRD